MSKRRQPGTDDGNALCDAALSYAKRGWHVLPLSGKRPLTALVPHGLKDATDDTARIARWWRQRPDANVGVACAASGLLVIDVDGEAGEGMLSALVERHGALPETVEVRSGGGGRHLYLTATDDLDVPGKLGDHVDLKHHGYVVAPPSVHPETGDPYAWADGASLDDRDLPPAPAAWIARATERDGSTQERFTDDAWQVSAGEVHEAMVSIAGTLRHNLALTPDEIADVLTVLSDRGRFGEAPEDREDHIQQVARSMANYPPGEVPWRYRSAKQSPSRYGRGRASGYGGARRRYAR